MSAKGQPKTPGSGRKKGKPNAPTQTLMDIVRRVGMDPFEVLVRLANEDWQGLGYPARTTTSFTSAGIEFEEFIISPELRGNSAKEATKYIHAQRKAVEHGIDPALAETIKSLEGKSEKELLAILKAVPQG